MADELPELVAGAGGVRGGVEGDGGEVLQEGVAGGGGVGCGESGVPGEDAVGHGPEEVAHEGGFVGERGDEVLAERLGEVFGVGGVGEFDEALRGLGREEAGVRDFGVEIHGRVGAVVEGTLRNGEDVPVAGGRGPGELAVSDVVDEVGGLREVGYAGGIDGVGVGELELARWEFEVGAGRSGAGLVGEEESASFPFRVVLQDESAGGGARVAAFVV